MGMKYFERTVVAHIMFYRSKDLDTLRSALDHFLYVKLVFINYSLVFNTIFAHKLVIKLVELGLCSSL